MPNIFPTKKCPDCGGKGRILDPKRVGAHIRELRERAGVSVMEMAIRTDLSFSMVWRLEQGQRRWTPERVKLFKKHLKK